jgi:hypothetical protein
MTCGLQVGGPVFTYHPRSTWVDPRYPVKGPAIEWVKVDTAVIHYTAADDLIDGDPGEHAENLPAYIRQIQQSYVTNRGYSIGYLFAVDWLGGVWQLRGWEFQSAANLGHNDHTFPILMLVDGDDRATSHAVASVRELIGTAQLLAERPLAIAGHKDIGSTRCPGVGLYAQVKAGVFTPLPPVPPVEDEVKPIVTTWETEPWPILVGFDPVLNQYTWRGFPGPDVDGLIWRGGANDCRSTPWPQAWKTEAWVRRVG